ncbi:ImmA/IrrE family metallo-endopeptidase [Salipaludibacillus agaradhaerens]|uniref:ImmA/IrrE family metallo-endopeptidase n=1 Tax=Salipaludibacillus agaradhaerens TaxID=76935 RepID=UPI002150BE74|nr:ImmA/IrrE family metallo-endopeptidase [Salipaludibacillus agaradhaerens]
MDIKQRVKSLVDKYDTHDPFKIANQLGIHVIYEQLGETLGYFSKLYRIPIVHINENTTKEQQLATCCHELGHAILHPNENTSFLKSKTYFPTSRIEKEANLFAFELLSYQGSNQIITVQEAIKDYQIPEQILSKNF